MNVRITALNNRLHVRFDASREHKLIWPSSGLDPRMSALIYPDGEGLYIPLDDAFFCYFFQAGAGAPMCSNR